MNTEKIEIRLGDLIEKLSNLFNENTKDEQRRIEIEKARSEIINTLKKYYDEKPSLNLQLIGKNIFKIYYFKYGKISISEGYDNKEIDIKNSEHFAEEVFDDIFVKRLKVDGYGNINEYKVKIDYEIINKDIQLNNLKSEDEKIKIQNNKNIKGGHISEQYKSFDRLVRESDERENKTILSASICTNLAYKDLIPRFEYTADSINIHAGYLDYSTVDDGYVSKKNIIKIKTDSTNSENNPNDINLMNYEELRQIDSLEVKREDEDNYYLKNRNYESELLTQKTPKNYFNNSDSWIARPNSNSDSWNERPNPNCNKKHIVVLLKWKDNESDVIPLSPRHTSSIKRNLRTYDIIKGIPFGHEENSFFGQSDVIIGEKPENIGMIRYYLIYDQNINKFILSVRGTDFGGNASINNWGINIQFGLIAMRNYARENNITRATSQDDVKLACLVDYVRNIIFDALFESKDVIHFFNSPIPVVGTTEIYKLVQGIIYGSALKPVLNQFVLTLVSIRPDNETCEQLFNIIKTNLSNLITEYRRLIGIANMLGLVNITDNTIFELSIILAQYIHNEYLQKTLIFSQNILGECKKVVKKILGDDINFNNNLIVCGHSLGGGIAEYLSATNEGIKGYAFDPAGAKITKCKLIFDNNGRINIGYIGNNFLRYTLLQLPGIISNDQINIRNFILEPTDASFYDIENTKNFAVKQDLIHKIRLSSDYSQIHFGKYIYMVSEILSKNFYVESYVNCKRETGCSEKNNVTNFHAMESLMLLLLKIYNNKGICLGEINPAVYAIDKQRGVPDNRDKFLVEEYGLGGGSNEEKYKDKYIKYKFKYINLKKSII